jgi:hypothetical protein
LSLPEQEIDDGRLGGSEKERRERVKAPGGVEIIFGANQRVGSWKEDQERLRVQEGKQQTGPAGNGRESNEILKKMRKKAYGPWCEKLGVAA